MGFVTAISKSSPFRPKCINTDIALSAAGLKFTSMLPTFQVKETFELKVPLSSELEPWQMHSAHRAKQFYWEEHLFGKLV